jgi:ATP-dependent Lhr-like helicase
LRRFEARGVALGGRFVGGLSGEQYALPEAAAALLKVHRSAPSGEQLVVAGADPLNVTGSIVGGARVPTRRNQQVIFRDGVVVEGLQAG